MGVRSHASSYIELGIVVVGIVLLVGFSIPLWAKHVDAFPKPAEGDVTQCRVIAHQFFWIIHYPGPDGLYGRRSPALIDSESNPIGLDAEDPVAADDIWTMNDLRVPLGKPGKLTWASAT